MNKDLAFSLGLGMASSLFFLMMGMGGPVAIISWFAPLPLICAGFRNGFRHVLFASGLGALLIGVVELSAFPVYAATTALAAIIIVYQALLWRPASDGSVEWASPGRVLGWLSAAGLGVMLVGLLWFGAREGGIEEGIAREVRAFIQQVVANAPPETGEQIGELLEKSADLTAASLPGLWSAIWLLLAVLNARLGLWIVGRTGRALRPAPVYKNAEAPDWLGLAFLAAGGLSVLVDGDVGYVLRNVAIFLAAPLLLAGLASVHRFLRGKSHAGALLALFYALFIFLFGWVVFILVGLGLMQFWIRLARKKRNAPDQEEK